MLVWGKGPLQEQYAQNHGYTSLKNTVILKNQVIKKAVLGDKSSCLLFNNGTIQTYGNNQGLEIQSPDTTFLNDSEVTDLFGGSQHTFALAEDQMYGWGCNNKGQLGFEPEDVVVVPRPILFSLTKQIISVACGQQHSILLTKDGALYAMGDNTYGQLGLGKFTSKPLCINLLSGVPFRQIAAGGWHSFAVTTSGRVYGWGRNAFGQLGLGNVINRTYPNRIESVDQSVAFVSAGDFHSVILTMKGKVLTFGLGSSGQLGHGSYENELRPKFVDEFDGSIVTQIACGYNHTVVYVPDCGNIFVFGDNANDQLWLNRRTKILQPEMVSLDFCKNNTNAKTDRYQLMQLSACSNQTGVIFTTTSSLADFRDTKSNPSIATLNISLYAEGQTFVDIFEQIRCVITSQSCLSGCFSLPDQVTTIEDPGVNLADAKQVFANICLLQTDRNDIVTSLSDTLLPSLLKNPSDIEALKVYILLPFLLQFFPDPYCIEKLFFPFVKIVSNLEMNASKILSKWYKSIKSDFSVIVKLCSLSIYVVLNRIVHYSPDSEQMSNMMQFIEKLYKLNLKNNIVSFRTFYLPCAVAPSFHWNSYAAWKAGTGTAPILISHPFLFDPHVKSSIFQEDAKLKNKTAEPNSLWNMYLGNMGLNLGFNQASIIKIEVDRENLLSDAICQKLSGLRDLQTTLHVTFKGEADVYNGVLTKNFFMLAFEEVFSTDYGLFCEKNDSHVLWFSEFVPGRSIPEHKYNFVGILCGLALHNDARINASFPLAFYKKLLLKTPNFEDFKEFDTEFGESLQKMLDYKEKDKFEKDMDFTFISSASGEPLKNGGENIALTYENREEYVRLQADYVLNDNVKVQYDAFSEGFLKICRRELLDIFLPEELMDVFVGQKDFNWKEVEKRMMMSTEAKTLDSKDSEILNWFWEVLHSLSSEEKNDFLVFLTSTNKVPLQGLKMEIFFRDEDDTFLPVALTCHNMLQLHRYSSKEILEERLKISIKCKQFHKPIQ